MKFILFNKSIIVINEIDNIVQEIFNITTYICEKKIGSGKNKFLQNYRYDLSKWKKNIFDSWNELLEYYKIDDINCYISGIYILNYNNTNIVYKRFFHTCFKKEGLYEEFWPNGKKKVKANYIRDTLNGLYEEFSLNGDLIKSINYCNGLMDGDYFELQKEYFNNKYINAHYDLGILNGQYTIKMNGYFELYMFIKGKKHGEFIIESKKYKISGEYLDNILQFLNVYNIKNILLEKIIKTNNEYIQTTNSLKNFKNISKNNYVFNDITQDDLIISNIKNYLMYF
jgi:hypothetical protein